MIALLRGDGASVHIISQRAVWALHSAVTPIADLCQLLFVIALGISSQPL